MQENIKISIIQSDIIWTDIDKNLTHFTNLVSKIKDSKFIFLKRFNFIKFVIELDGGYSGALISVYKWSLFEIKTLRNLWMSFLLGQRWLISGFCPVSLD